MKCHILIFVIFIYLFGNCQSLEKKDVVLNACFLSQNIDSSYGVIESNAKKVFRISSDTCVIKLIDSIVSRGILSKNEKYLVLFDSLCNASDGYVSEYLSEVSYEYFLNVFEKTVNYLSRKKALRSNRYEDFIIEGIILIAENSNNSIEKLSQIELFVLEKANQCHFDDTEKNYIKKLLSLIKKRKTLN